jgi:hypothetical protein
MNRVVKIWHDPLNGLSAPEVSYSRFTPSKMPVVSDTNNGTKFFECRHRRSYNQKTTYKRIKKREINLHTNREILKHGHIEKEGEEERKVERGREKGIGTAQVCEISHTYTDRHRVNLYDRYTHTQKV